ncbi:MAG: hypothetical protein ACRBDI_03980 [Alphaproteobacteria bacterium]
MKKPVLLGLLSFIFVFAMVVVGGQIGVSDAAQLWNKKSDSKGAGNYYNSKKKSDGNTQLFNGRSPKGKIGKSKHSARLDQQMMEYENEQQAGSRIPALFQYMSPYSVSNRLDDTQVALMRQSKRKQETRLHLKKKREEADRSNFREVRAKNREKLMSRYSSSKSAKKRRKDKVSGNGSDSSKKDNSSSDVNVFNSKDNARSDVSVTNQGTKIYNTR